MIYLGVIRVTAGAAANNVNTAAPFVIPSAARALRLQCDTSGVQFALGAGTTFATTAAAGAFLPAANVLSDAFVIGNLATVVSIWNPTGGIVNVRVYAVPA